MRYVSNHVACLLFVCFTQGAWSCLNQNIDVKARHSSFLRPERLLPLGERGAEEGEENEFDGEDGKVARPRRVLSNRLANRRIANDRRIVTDDDSIRQGYASHKNHPNTRR